MDEHKQGPGGEGVTATVPIGQHPKYQVPLAQRVKEALTVPVIAVGRLDAPTDANDVVVGDEADLVAVGRGMLLNPYWALEASIQLGLENAVPRQYVVGFPRK